MANYKSNEEIINASAETVFNKFSNLEGLGKLLQGAPAEMIPDDKKELLDQVKVTPDTISFPGGPAGEVTMRLSELEMPTLIRLEGVGTPVAMSMALHIRPVSEQECGAMVEVDLKVPALVAPMINGPMKQLVAQVAGMLKAVPMN